MARVASSSGPDKRMPASRARNACARCRKQKLRCDNERPCALCVRSDVDCEEIIQPPRKRARTSSNQLLDTAPQSIRPENLGSSRQVDGARIVNAKAINSETDPRYPESQSEASKRDDTAPSPHQERASTYGLVDQLFQKYDSVSGLLTEANAIPDGTSGQASSMPGSEKLVLVSDLIGLELPPPEITWMLLDIFLNSVHWFMMVFHEPTLRTELEELMNTGRVQKRRLSFLVLVMVILTIGIKYATNDSVQMHYPEPELTSLQSKLMSKIEAKFLDIFDEDDIGSVQVCILLSSVYIYHGRPKRSFVIHGAALKAAQALRLQKESTWGRMEPVAQEVRRRVWWALFVSEGFAAISYGRPCHIRDEDWQVHMPRNIDDTSDRCPGFDSVELLEDGTYEVVTTLSYQRFKFRLYRIASPIARDVYFHKGATTQEVLKRVQHINRRLLEWEHSVPPELRPSSFPAKTDGSNTDPILRIFRLQALSLQLAYDNIQLVLHRPLLAYSGLPHGLNLSDQPDRGDTTSRNNDNGDLSKHHRDAAMLRTSKARCWDSAIRTSCIDKHPEIVRLARNTHAAGYTGIQTFTAGVMLGIFALSSPFSPQAQEAKRAIGRLIKMPKLLDYRTAISDQSGRILEELLRLILSEEMKLLVSDGESANRVFLSERAIHTASLNKPTEPISSFAKTDISHEKRAWPNSQPDSQEHVSNEHLGLINESSTVNSSIQRPELNISHTTNNDNTKDLVSNSNAPVYSDHELALTGNFNDALLFLQQAFRDNGETDEGWRHFPAQATGREHTQRHEQNDSVAGAALPHPSPNDPFIASNILAGLNDTGGAWIWDDSFQFT